MLYFQQDGTPINFSTVANVGTLETPGDMGNRSPLHGAGTQVNPKSLTMQTPAPTTQQNTPLPSPGAGAQAAIQGMSPMMNSIKDIIQNRQYASPAQQAGSPVYQDPNMQIGPANPSASEQAAANADAGNQAQMASSMPSGMNSGGVDVGGQPVGGGGMGGGNMGLGSAVGSMLQRASEADFANAQKEMQIANTPAQTGTAQAPMAQFITPDLSQSNMPL